MKTSAITIREPAIQDLKLLQALARKTFYETYAEKNTAENMNMYLSEVFSLEQIRAELVDSTSKFYLIEKNKLALGYTKLNLKPCAAWQNRSENGLEIERIYVDANYQGQGIGKILLMHAEEVAKYFSCRYMWLGVWQENANAIQFYKKNKFEIVGALTFTLGLDNQCDWLMAKAV